MGILSETLAEEYRMNGYVRDVPDDAGFAALVAQGFAEASRLAENSGAIQKKWTHSSGKAKHLVNVHRSSQVFRQIIQSPLIAERLSAIYGRVPLQVTHSKLSLKFAGIEQVWVPHQDSAYKTHRGPLTTVAVFLEACNQANGALHFFPGSHQAGRLTHELVFVANESEPQIRLKRPIGIEPLIVDGPRGTTVLFDGHMVHQSGPNMSSGVRPILLFEVEPVRRLALEADGRDAIVLNGPHRHTLPRCGVGLVRRAHYCTELLLKPLAKRMLFAIYRRVLRRDTSSL